MRKSRYTEEQIIGFIKPADAGVNVADRCRKEGFSTATFYKWRAKTLARNEQDILLKCAADNANRRVRLISQGPTAGAR